MPPLTRALERVVVTGLGAVTPLAATATASWRSLIEGKSGIGPLKEDWVEEKKIKSKVAATIPVDEKESFLHAKAPLSPLFVQYALAAAKEAMEDANYEPKSEDEKRRAGVAVGSGIGNIDEIANAVRTMDTRGIRRISPYFVTHILVNMAAGQISIAHNLKGPNHAASTACATGANAIGDAFRIIRSGDADVMLAGGTESCIDPLSLGGFSQMRALSTKYNDTPEAASRPFDTQRDGFVIGEGAAVLMLESLSHAQKRGAKCYAEIVGYGMSGDAHHVTAPSPFGHGAEACMRAALKDADLDPRIIGYINAHATSTPLGDKIEAAAISRLFGAVEGVENENLPYVSSVKGAIGHTLGAAGAIEALFAILALHENVLPPTLNLHNPEAAIEGWATGDEALKADEIHYPPINHIPFEAIRPETPIQAVLSNSFGFGGVNASLAFVKSQVIE
eukprot:jgi/Bigna1/142710/aug1.72_g17418